MYHDEPLYVAFDLAISLGTVPPDAHPDQALAQTAIDYVTLREQIFAGRPRSVAIRHASVA